MSTAEINNKPENKLSHSYTQIKAEKKRREQ